MKAKDALDALEMACSFGHALKLPSVAAIWGCTGEELHSTMQRNRLQRVAVLAEAERGVNYGLERF